MIFFKNNYNIKIMKDEISKKLGVLLIKKENIIVKLSDNRNLSKRATTKLKRELKTINILCLFLREWLDLPF